MADVGAGSRLGARLPLLLAVAWLATACCWAAFGLQRDDAGRLVYCQDDPYIHLSLARGLVDRGVWGLPGGEFAALSSSPAWTLLIAGGLACGLPAHTWPLWLSGLFAVALVLGLDGVLRRWEVPRGVAAWTMIAVVVAAPLGVLWALGMEHAAHALANLLLTFAGAELLTERGDRRRLAGVCLLAAACVAMRYEGLFTVAALAALLLVRRRYAAALAVVAAGAAPAVAAGLYFVGQGGSFLPNTLLLKARASAAESGLRPLLDPLEVARQLRTGAAAGMLLVAVGCLSVAARGRPSRPAAGPLAGLFVIQVLLHAYLGSVGCLGRYEAYLVVVGVAVVVVLMADAGWFEAGPRTRATTWWLLLLAYVALGQRVEWNLLVYSGSAGVWQQQAQMARFFREHHAGETVAVNDVGLVSYAGEVAVLDLYGLATTEVCRLKCAGRLDAAAIDRLAREHAVRVAALYEDWYAGLIPPGWTKVADLTTRDAGVLGGSRVAFYGTSPAATAELEADLRRFESSLPPGAGLAWAAH